MRARGAWFGNRSISAGVDIEPRVYEVVPKIVAKRDPDAPDVHEVIEGDRTQFTDIEANQP